VFAHSLFARVCTYSVPTHCVRICYTFQPPFHNIVIYTSIYTYTRPRAGHEDYAWVLCKCVWARLDRRWQVKGGGELIYRKKSAGNISWLSWAHIFPPPPPTPMRISLSTFSHFIFPETRSAPLHTCGPIIYALPPARDRRSTRSSPPPPPCRHPSCHLPRRPQGAPAAVLTLLIATKSDPTQTHYYFNP